jgi:hypothetical protein
MDDLTKIITAVFGGVILIAIASVIVGRKSQAPQAIQSIGSAIGNIVAAAVNPVSANYGYGGGQQAGTSPGNGVIGDITGGFGAGSAAALSTLSGVSGL